MKRTGRPDAGIALPSVIIGMAVVTLFAIVALSVVIRDEPADRRTGDSQAAVAAAQAGIDEYTTRLNADPAYYTIGGGADPANKAFVTTATGTAFTDGRDPSGVPVPGSSSAARFSYQLLTVPAKVIADGKIRVKSTGTVRGTTRSITATFGKPGFLEFLYFTDIESRDPVFGARQGSTLYQGDNGSRLYSYRDASGRTRYIFPDEAMFQQACSKHWYNDALGVGRGNIAAYRVTPAAPVIGRLANGGPATDEKYYGGASVVISCVEISFGGGDVIAGPLHTNDAMSISTGGVDFQNDTTETSWLDGSSPPPPAGYRWRDNGGGTTLVNKVPKEAAVRDLPTSNGELLTVASQDGKGCVYSGATEITFNKTSMTVRSPATTTSSSPGCFNPSNRANAQTITKVPPVIYVTDAPSCGGAIGYPRSGEATKDDDPSLLTMDYGCQYGNAFVRGEVTGRTTLATSRDVVVVGDITYADSNGSDVLGLIPTNFAWVYHPVKKANTAQDLISPPPVTRIDAAVLALNHSFVVQNYEDGTPRSGSSIPTLNITGVIAQKYRGPVGSTTGGGFTGYRKNYQYDKRLQYLPPPYFLTPDDAKWTVERVSEG